MSKMLETYFSTARTVMTRWVAAISFRTEHEVTALKLGPTGDVSGLTVVDEPQALFSPQLMPRVLRPRRRAAAVPNDFAVPDRLPTR